MGRHDQIDRHWRGKGWQKIGVRGMPGVAHHGFTQDLEFWPLAIDQQRISQTAATQFLVGQHILPGIAKIL